MHLLRLWLAVLVAVMCSCLPEEQASFDPTASETTADPTTGGSTSPTEATEPDIPDPGSTSSTGDSPSESTSEASATDTGEVPLCGNGVVEPGEMCDEGDEFNLETATCLPNCALATCGDGFVQAGVEQCDLGETNSYDYGGCIPGTCFWGPACGDGEVAPGHEICDPGAPVDPMGGELTPCGPECRFEGRVVFLSSDTYTGKELGGLTGADAKCRQLARSFDPERFHTYRAWLSDATSEPASTFDHSKDPYVLLNGVAIADSFDDLTLTGPTVGITITDAYAAVDDVFVWTHTTLAGTKIVDDLHCEQWSSEAFDQLAMVGRNSVPIEFQTTWTNENWWTRYIEDGCNFSHHLYCFEN